MCAESVTGDGGALGGILVALIVALVGAVITLGVAFFQIRHRHRLAARAATLTFISTHETHSAHLSELLVRFRELDRGKMLPHIATQDDSDTVKVSNLLNHYELVATGIRHKIIDEKLYSEWLRGSYVRVWTRAKPFVLARRKHKRDDNLYKAFEELAKRWSE